MKSYMNSKYCTSLFKVLNNQLIESNKINYIRNYLRKTLTNKYNVPRLSNNLYCKTVLSKCFLNHRNYNTNQYFLNRITTSGLHSIFEPRSIAIIGATDRPSSVGRTIVNNLIEGNKLGGYQYQIYPVNPTRKEVLGLQCYPTIEDIPNTVDMAIIVTPAKSCIETMKQCAKKNIESAIVISAGFKEAGHDGQQLEKQLIQIARDAGIRVIGPNCVGVMNPNFGLNATFAATMGLPGNVAFISQSGAMCTAILDWSLKEKVGFSAFVSLGSMADVNWGDLLDYLGSDPNTHSILIYMEAIGDISSFISAARQVALKKPISIIKAGKTNAAAQAAASHTGSLAGSYAAFEATMRQVGILTAESIQELSDITLVLSKQPLPKGPKLMMITNAGGPAVLATDAAVNSGAEIAKLSEETIKNLNSFLPSAWSHSNPVDILGDAPAELYAKTLEVLISDQTSDGVLVILSPQDVTDPTATAKALIKAVEQTPATSKKPILAAWMGGDTVQEGFQLLSKAGIPTFSQPDSAATTFGRIWKQIEVNKKLTGECEHPSLQYIPPTQSTKSKALDIITKVYNDQRTLLTESESKEIVQLYGIPTAQTILAKTSKEALKAAKDIGKTDKYAVKLNSKTLTHKADVGGVQLNLTCAQVPKAFEQIKNNVHQLHGSQHFQGVTVQPMIQLDKGIELILGSTYDPQFGPVMLFGSGGTLVEVYKDTALAIPPINDNIAENLIKSTKIYKALKGGQGKRFEGVNIPEVKLILKKFSHMIVDLADVVSECDINPLLATQDKKFIALDARIVLKKTKDTNPIIAQKPYPVEYISNQHFTDLGSITFRPTLPSDKEKLIEFHKQLSNKTITHRYLKDISFEHRTHLNELTPLCYSNYDDQITLIALKENEIIGLCEFQRPPKNHHYREKGQIQIVVADEYQKKGVGKALITHALDVARKEGVKEIYCVTLQNNEAFVKLMARLGWKVKSQSQNKSLLETTIKL